MLLRAMWTLPGQAAVAKSWSLGWGSWKMRLQHGKRRHHQLLHLLQSNLSANKGAQKVRGLRQAKLHAT